MKLFVTKAEVDQLVREVVKDRLAFDIPYAAQQAVAAAAKIASSAAAETEKRAALDRDNSERADGKSCAVCRFAAAERDLVYASLLDGRERAYFTKWTCRRSPLSIPVRENYWCGEWTATGRAK